MNSNGQEYINHKKEELKDVIENETAIDENYIDTGEHCTEKGCNGILQMSYNANGPDDYAKTWTCNVCGLTESE